MLQVRPSSMDRFMDCARSALAPAARHDPSSIAQRGGSATHEAIWYRISKGEDPDLAELAARWGLLDDSELTIPYALWRRAWQQLEQWFPEPQPELALYSDITSGTADLVSATPQQLSGADWKAGRVDRSNYYQNASYAYCLRNRFGMPSSGVIRFATVYLRFESCTVYDFDDDELDGFAARYREQLERIDEHVAAGEQCTFCPRRLECDTRSAYLRSAIALLEATPLDDPAQLAALYPRVQQVSAAVDAFKDALRLAAAERPLPVGDGRVVRLKTQTRKTIKPREAWPVLEQTLTQDELAASVTLGKGMIERLVKAKVAKGKGAAAQAMIARLHEAGAIDESVSTRLEIGRGDE